MPTPVSNLQIVCDNEEEFKCLQARAVKLRTILLEKQSKNVFYNISSMNPREKKKFVNELSRMWNEMSDSEIDEEFNSICCESLFHAGKDVSNYPVQYKTMPDHSILYPSQSEMEEVPVKLPHIEELSFEESKS